MRFLPTDEQRAFARSLDALLTAADTPSVVRSWGAGDHTAGRALWSRLAEAGVFALAVPEAYEGVGPLPVELALAFVELGRHAVPGPVVETVLAAALLSGAPEHAERLLPQLASGKSVATVGAPYALDGDAADVVLALRGHEVWLSPGCRPEVKQSLDPARRLATPLPGGELLIPRVPPDALDRARLVTAAQALGVGLALLDRTVEYVGQRVQFGVPIGSFQAVKHQLADAKIALEFARPLLFGAALSMTSADVAAAKVAACEAAYATARTALQLHGAIGYTAEYDLSLWLTKARALRTAWGTPPECRDTVLGGAHPGH
ncbi:acyl-CoA dehydrogenase family protein [Streptomyces yaanensis]|uniref:Acyl-CoA dehydrogenase family protein n=1 Tax=Streptomyces yaanensis TaxID=1142239 RepID=A0ABV7SH55_9ACTN|nr:acyl-CoA dehydrogenase family protein [Streptomyces sp. CGMCC 4.7035]WNC01265.1 acyl-CoA dehydrogenase family protein [Streptomyces sp. CGMCC 4.7035]